MPDNSKFSFNTLKIISDIGKSLLVFGDPSDVIMQVLSKLGNGLNIDRTYIFKNRVDKSTGVVSTNYSYEWCAEGIVSQIERALTQDLRYSDHLPRWYDMLSRGEFIYGNIKDFPQEERWILEPQNIQSILVVPIIYKDVFWGFMGFDYCKTQRDWQEEEIQTLAVAASMISNYMIRTKIQEELRENEYKWYAALESDNEGVVDYDVKTDKIFISDKGMEILGIENNNDKKSARSHVNNILDGNNYFIKDIIDSVLKDGSSSTEELFCNVEGYNRWFQTKGVVVNRGVFGEPLRVVCTFTDITERKEFDAQLKQALVAAETANKAKSSFLATMSHEIRTPLNAMMGFLHLLYDYVTDETGKEYIKIIDASTETLLNIINAILDLSKIENGDMSLEISTCTLIDELEALTRQFGLQAFYKKTSLCSFIDPRIPDIIKCDQLRIRQLLSNILNNSIKFTEENGELFFSATVANKTEDRVDIEFSISDTGIGIPKELQNDIFKPFTQADSSVSRRFGGSGLGLTISNKFVELMGGKIKLISDIGNGSTFYFTLSFPIVKDNNDDYISNINIGYLEYPRCKWGFGKSFASIGSKSVYYESVKDMPDDKVFCDIIVLCGFSINDKIFDDLKYLRNNYSDKPIILSIYDIDSSVYSRLEGMDVKIVSRTAPLRFLYETIRQMVKK